jgi:DNA-binding transcriptional MocR family regulator
MVLWVELPRGASALDVHRRALARGISIAPGPIFSAKQQFQGFLRISCGFPWSETIERAIVTLGQICAT